MHQNVRHVCYHLQESNLRFRIKFAQTVPTTTSLATCKDCIRTLEAFFPINEMPAIPSSSAMEVGDSQIVYEESQTALQIYTTTPSAQDEALSSCINYQEKHHLTSNTNQQRHDSMQATTSSIEDTPSQRDLLSLPDIAKVSTPTKFDLQCITCIYFNICVRY